MKDKHSNARDKHSNAVIVFIILIIIVLAFLYYSKVIDSSTYSLENLISFAEQLGEDTGIRSKDNDISDGTIVSKEDFSLVRRK